MTPAVRRSWLVLALILIPATLCAKLREPSFDELCREADAVAAVHVTATFPALFSLEAQLALCFIVSAAGFAWAARSRRKARAFRVALGLAGLPLVVGLSVSLGVFTPQRIAAAKVSRVLKGSLPDAILVDYKTNFACDTTQLNSGGDYVLFLDRNSVAGYRTVWCQFSVWPITTGGIESPLTIWSGITAPAESFFDAVSGILR